MFPGHPSTGILGLEMVLQNTELFLRRFLGASPGGGSVAMVDVTDVCPYKRCPYCMSPTRKAHFASPCTICGGPYKPTETPAPFQGERRCRPKNSATGARHARQNRNSLSCLDWLLIQFGRSDIQERAQTLRRSVGGCLQQCRRYTTPAFSSSCRC